MSSERKKASEKFTSTSKSRVHDSEDDRSGSRGIKIYIKRTNDDETLTPAVDEEKFEQLKALYYKQCQPINMNLIRKLADKRSATDYNYRALHSANFGTRNHKDECSSASQSTDRVRKQQRDDLKSRRDRSDSRHRRR